MKKYAKIKNSLAIQGALCVGMIGVKAKVVQEMTGDDCRESVFHSHHCLCRKENLSSKTSRGKLFNLFFPSLRSATSCYYEALCSHTDCEILCLCRYANGA